MCGGWTADCADAAPSLALSLARAPARSRLIQNNPSPNPLNPLLRAGVLTETTAELAAALTLSAARRIVEADAFMRGGHYAGWLPTLFIGSLLQGKTVGIVGAGRIGAAYARMMVEGHKMDLVYFDPYPNKALERRALAALLSGGSCRRQLLRARRGAQARRAREEPRSLLDLPLC